jgi:hypothetical protein
MLNRATVGTTPKVTFGVTLAHRPFSGFGVNSGSRDSIIKELSSRYEVVVLKKKKELENIGYKFPKEFDPERDISDGEESDGDSEGKPKE